MVEVTKSEKVKKVLLELEETPLRRGQLKGFVEENFEALDEVLREGRLTYAVLAKQIEVKFNISCKTQSLKNALCMERKKRKGYQDKTSAFNQYPIKIKDKTDDSININSEIKNPSPLLVNETTERSEGPRMRVLKFDD